MEPRSRLMDTRTLLQVLIALALATCCWSLPFGPFFYFNPPHMSGVLDHRGNINNIGLFDMHTLQQPQRQHEPTSYLLSYDNNPRSLAVQRRAALRQGDLFQYAWFAPYYNRPLYEEIRDMERR